MKQTFTLAVSKNVKNVFDDELNIYTSEMYGFEHFYLVIFFFFHNFDFR